MDSRPRLSLLTTLAALALTGTPCGAEIGALDTVPAATVLLPYFEVGLEGSGSRTTTLFSLNNARAEPAVVHVTLWTELARPTLDFDLYLTGYDVVTVNLADLFLRGRIPRTGPDYDPGDDPVTPDAPGAFSAPDAAPPGCDFPLPAELPASLLAYIRNLHTGLPAPPGFDNAGLCGASPTALEEASEGVAVGYLTADVVNDCSLLFPGNPGYFGDGGTGIAANDNLLWGDYFLANPDDGFAHGDPLVQIEARSSVQEGFWQPGDYTFYGRYHGFDARDNREPLATTWMSRYVTAEPPRGAFTGPSSFLCWRDTGLDDSFFFTCGTIPAPFPLGSNAVVFFDEQENPAVGQSFPFSPVPPFLDFVYCRNASTRESASNFRDREILPPFFEMGWFFLNLNTSTGSVSDPIKQSHVTTLHRASGAFSVGFQSIALDSALAKTFTVTSMPTDTTLP